LGKWVSLISRLASYSNKLRWVNPHTVFGRLSMRKEF